MAQLRDGTAFSSLAFSPNGERIAVVCNPEIKLYSAKTFKPILDLEQGDSARCSAAFSPDGKLLAAGGTKGGVNLWDAKTGKVRAILQGRHSVFSAVVFSPDGDAVATGGKDYQVAIWDLKKDEERIAFPTKHKRGWLLLAYAPDGKTLASAGWGDSTVRLWDPADGKLLKTLEVDDGVCCIAFSPDGKWLAAGRDHKVSLWSADSFKLCATLTGFNDNTLVLSLAFSPDSTLLATAGGAVFGVTPGGEIKLWDVPPKEDK